MSLQRNLFLIPDEDDGELEPYRSPTTTFGAYDPRERPWFQTAVSSDRLVWTSPCSTRSTARGMTASVWLSFCRPRSSWGSSGATHGSPCRFRTSSASPAGVPRESASSGAASTASPWSAGRRGVTIYEPLGRKGEVPEGRLRERDRYQDGLRAYFEARFEEGLEIFGELRGLDSPDRAAAAVLYDRISELLHTEVPDGWDGTHTAPFK